MSKENQLLEIIAEILEEDSVQLTTDLEEGNWDSLAIVSFISEVDSEFDIILAPAKVAEAKLVSDLVNMV
jgi:acyl carrier protein